MRPQVGRGYIQRVSPANPPAHAEHRTAAPSDEADLVARLRNGDESAFERLVEEYYGTMLAVARTACFRGWRERKV